MRSIVLLALLPALAACSASYDSTNQGTAAAASGGGTARSYAIADFTKIDLRGPDDVDVRVGGQFAVRASGPVKALDDLVITKTGDTLRVERRNGVHIGFSGGRDVTVFVTLPRIAAASISGSGDMSIDKVDAGPFTAASTGSGDFTFTHLAVDAADLSLSGSGDISANGRATRLTVASQGSGDVDAKGLSASQAKVSVAGSGDVTVTVDGAATVSSTGSGDVDLGPGARCTTSKSGSGEVTCGH